MTLDQAGNAGNYHDGRLHARAGVPAIASDLGPGTYELGFGGRRAALLHVPAPATAPAPLLLLLHGAANLDGGADALALDWARRRQAFVLVPKAAGTSWDFLRGGFGPDLAFLDQLLAWTMQRYAIDPANVSIAGFSDGASYALSVGLMNGDLFSDILAFSPGCARPLHQVGQPRIFIGHGQLDPVLPLSCGQNIARSLSEQGYAVRFEAFDGAHYVSPEQASGALGRLAPVAQAAN